MIYMIPTMVNIGLEEGQNFSSEDHRIVAENISICNPNVKSADLMKKVVQAVLKVPMDRIKKVTYKELVKEFGLPEVFNSAHFEEA